PRGGAWENSNSKHERRARWIRPVCLSSLDHSLDVICLVINFGDLGVGGRRRRRGQRRSQRYTLRPIASTAISVLPFELSSRMLTSAGLTIEPSTGPPGDSLILISPSLSPVISIFSWKATAQSPTPVRRQP